MSTEANYLAESIVALRKSLILWNLWLLGGRIGRKQGVWDGHVHTAIFKMDN